MAQLNVLRQIQQGGTPPQSDDFQRTTIGWRWVPVGGTISATHPNGTAGAIRGVGPYTGFGSKNSAMRYFAPLFGTAMEVAVGVYIPTFVVGTGVTNVLVCADQQLAVSYIAAQFDASREEGKVTVRLCYGAGGSYPESMTIKAEAQIEMAAGVVEPFRIVYDQGTGNTASVYRGDATEPVVTLPSDVAPATHGMGYTYFGFSWQGDLLTTGPQITSWSISDVSGS